MRFLRPVALRKLGYVVGITVPRIIVHGITGLIGIFLKKLSDRLYIQLGTEDIEETESNTGTEDIEETESGTETEDAEETESETDTEENTETETDTETETETQGIPVICIRYTLFLLLQKRPDTKPSPS